MLAVPVDSRSSLRSLRYFLRTHLLRKRLLTANVPPLGLQVRAYSRDLVGRHLYKRGTYETELSTYVLRHLQMPEDAIVLDIGANLGWYSLLLGRRFPNARIHAFEPEPRNLELLRENLKLNHVRNVSVHAAAVAEQGGTMELYPYAEKNMGRHSLLPINDQKPVSVQVVQLDEFLVEQVVAPEQVGFVKIDVEGYEVPALRGAQKLLAAGPPILSEFAPKYMRRGGLEPRDYLELFAGHGYAPFEFDGQQLQPCTEQRLQGEQRLDLIWVRR